MSEPNDAPEPEMLEAIRENVVRLKEIASREMGVSLELAEESIKWIDGYIDRIRDEVDEGTKDTMIDMLGAFLGETIIRNHGGKWEFSDGVLGVRLEGGLFASPFSKVAKQMREGPEHSIHGFYRATAAMRDHLAQESGDGGLEDDLKIEGKIIRGTFSTCTPKIRASRLRLLHYHDAAGCLARLALVPAIPLIIFALLQWTIPAVVSGLLFLAAMGLAIFVAGRIAEASENAVLTPSVVVSASPLRLLALANMNTGASDEPILAMKLVEFSRIPRHSCEIGEVIPCVSVFRGDGLEKWDDFSPQPLSFATGDMAALQANTDLLDPGDIALLRKHVKEKSHPSELRELRWIANENA